VAVHYLFLGSPRDDGDFSVVNVNSWFGYCISNSFFLLF